MATAQTVWGIDVGRCALKALKLRAAGDGKVEVLAHDYIEHEKILSEPDANRQELIAHALEKFLSRNDITKDQVYLSVPGEHTLARFTKLPPVAPKRIPDIVRYEADQQIPFDMDEVIWDYQIFEQDDLPDVEVGIFAMKRELLREHLLHFEQASIEPSGVQACPLAVYNGAHFDGVLGSETTVILDIGAENIDLVIATPGSLWTRTIPIGGNSFTEALVKSFKLSFSKAESLKRTADSSKYRRQIFQAMRPVFADIVQELQRSIGFYSSTHREAHIDSVVGYGNAFKLPGLQKYLQQNLGITVTVPSSHSDIVSTGSAGGGALVDEFPAFAVAFGLAVQGLDLAKVCSNLLPATIAKQAVWRRKRPAFAATAACLVLAGALIWFRYTTDMSALAAGVGEADKITISDSEAPGIIDNGPSPSMSAWGQAASVQKAGQRLKKALTKLSGEGQDEREETQKLIDIQESKGLVLRILQTVHDSLPPEEEALSTAKSQQEVLEAIQEGRLPPRSKRKEVTLQAVQMQYEPNLNDFTVQQSLIDVEERINDADAELPGFSLEITCRSPHEDGAAFVGDSFLPLLRSNGRKPGLGFYFDRVWLISGVQLSSGGLAPAILPASGYRSGGRRGASDDKMALDPLTLESMENDLEFRVWVDVILEEYPETEEDEEAVDEG